MRWTTAISPVLLAGAALVVATPAAAKHRHRPSRLGATSTFESFGSLGASATIAEQHGSDTTFWMTAQPIPLRGQVRVVQMRGCAQTGPGGQTPLTEFHFQVLRPDPGGGGVTVTATSDALNMPVCGHGAGANTIATWDPRYLCVTPGEVVGFSDSGGFAPPGFPDGVPYQVFGADSSASTEFYVGNGPHYGASTLPGVALPLQVQVGVGTNARPFCR